MAENRNTNLAYKFDKFEDYAKAAQKKPIRARTAEHKPSAAPQVIGSIMVLAVCLAVIITGKAQIAEIHGEIIKQEAAVHALETENAGMKAQLEAKSSQKAVEDYAENVLGMQKLDKSQIEYVSLESGNVVEIPDNDTNILESIRKSFNKFVEYLKG